QGHAMTSIFKDITILKDALAFLRCYDATIFACVNLTTMDASIGLFVNGDLTGGIGIDLTILNVDTCCLTHKHTVLVSFVDLAVSQCRVGVTAMNADAGTCLTSQATILQQCLPLANINRVKIVRILFNIAPKGQAVYGYILSLHNQTAIISVLEDDIFG